jgi:hypothetical protein
VLFSAVKKALKKASKPKRQRSQRSFEDGRTYDGEWLDGKQDGLGSMRYSEDDYRDQCYGSSFWPKIIFGQIFIPNFSQLFFTQNVRTSFYSKIFGLIFAQNFLTNFYPKTKDVNLCI